MNTVRVLLLRMDRLIRVPQPASKILGPRGWYWWSSRKFRNCSGTALVVWMLGNGEISTFGLRHFLALLSISGSRAVGGPCDEMNVLGRW